MEGGGLKEEVGAVRTEELRWRARRTNEQTKEGANGRGTALMEIERATESPSFAAARARARRRRRTTFPPSMSRPKFRGNGDNRWSKVTRSEHE